MENRLEHLSEFKELLASYQPTPEARSLIESTKLAMLVSPSAAGRNTIIKELAKTGRYYFIVSDTTRHPRINNGVAEQNGVEYWFKSEAEVLNGLRQHRYFEAAVIHNQQVSGTSLAEFEKAHQADQIAISDIEIVGVANLIKLKPNASVIFILPPSFEEWVRRFDKRSVMPEKEKRLRFESAIEELKASLKEPYYKFVINDNIDNAIQAIEAIAERAEVDEAEQSRGRQLAEELIQATEKYLKQQS